MSNMCPDNLIRQLNRSSAAYEDPSSLVPWDRLAFDDYWLPVEALSLSGLSEFEHLDENRKQALSRYEFLNFIEAGIWLEGIFMERMARGLRQRHSSLAELRYRVHEIREESGHTLMFLDLIERAGLELSGKQWAPLVLDVFARLVPLESMEFWLATVLGEEVPDQMNRYVRRHEVGVNAAIVQMCALHIKEEARHIAYARELVRVKAGEASRPRRAVASTLMNYLLRRFLDAFYCPQADVYERAGLSPGSYWQDLARANPTRRRFLNELIEPSIRLLQPLGLSVAAP
ncbi:MAG: diiron oxygenase [Acidiferrobacteraceae bacterium]